MGNRWHADQNNNMRPDVVPLPCAWCGHSSVVTDTELFKYEYMSAWEAQSSCHECGAKGPDTGIARFPDHPLSNEYKNVDWEDEREVVNFAVQIWNIRK